MATANEKGLKRKANATPEKNSNKKTKQGDSEEDEIEVVENISNDDSIYYMKFIKS